MLEQLAISLIIAFVLSYFLTRDIFHPAVIMSGLWMVMVNLYAFTEHPLNPLSNKFCLALSYWVFPFLLMSIIVSRVMCCLICQHRFRDANVCQYLKLYPYIKVYAVVYIITLLFYSGGSMTNLRNYLVLGNFPPFLKLLMYLNTFMAVYVTHGLLNYKLFEKKKIVLLVILLLIISVFNSNKTGFLSIFIIALFVYKRSVDHIKIRHIVWLVIILLFFLVLVTMNRGDLNYLSSSDNALLDYLYIYLLSPLAAFDYLLNSNAVLDHGTQGSATFSFFYRVFNSLGSDYKIAELGDWVNVPLVTNVFTVMRGYYLDWGMGGILTMSFLMGSLWGVFYSLQKRNFQTWVLFYAMIVGYLFFQTFGDYFWNSMSIVIQFYLFSFFLNKKVRLINNSVL